MSRIDPIVLDNHGERMVPELSGHDTFWEHVCRYRFSSDYVQGKRVLDIACGDGYGSAAMIKAGAASVIGMDVSETAVANAKGKYGVDARLGDAEAIPLPDASIDLVISFETVEHVRQPEQFLRECRRVLSPSGMLIMSTPNKSVYFENNPIVNPHHLSEMSAGEFTGLIGRHFSKCKMFAQVEYDVPWFSLRLFASSVAQYSRVPGVYRLRRKLLQWSRSRISSPLPSEIREAPVDEILSRETFIQAMINPSAVRPWRGDSRPVYLLAVAQP